MNDAPMTMKKAATSRRTTNVITGLPLVARSVTAGRHTPRAVGRSGGTVSSIRTRMPSRRSGHSAAAGRPQEAGVQSQKFQNTPGDSVIG